MRPQAMNGRASRYGQHGCRREQRTGGRSCARFAVLAVGLFLSLPLQAATQAVVPASLRGYWVAYSHTALSITGDIVLTRSQIVFQNRKRFSLAYVGKRAGISVESRLPPADVFRLRDVRDVVLFNDNTLCGGGAMPRYLAIVRLSPHRKELGGVGYPSGAELSMAVLTGRPVPRDNVDEPRICAEYSFSPL